MKTISDKCEAIKFVLHPESENQIELEDWLRQEAPSITQTELQHIIKCIKSIVADIFEIHSAGHFGRAVIANDFISAVLRADEINVRYLRLYARFLVNYVAIGKLAQIFALTDPLVTIIKSIISLPEKEI